jgi:hypothetical protein
MEIPQRKFVSGKMGWMVDLSPTSGDGVQSQEQSQQGPRKIYGELDDVRPDDRRQASFEGVEQRKSSDDEQGSEHSRLQNDFNNDRNGKYAYPFRQGPGDQKQGGCENLEAATETALNELISGE